MSKLKHRFPRVFGGIRRLRWIGRDGWDVNRKDGVCGYYSIKGVPEIKLVLGNLDAALWIMYDNAEDSCLYFALNGPNHGQRRYRS